MARLEQLPEPQRSHIAKTKLPSFDSQPWVSGPPLTRRRIAIVSTAGLHRRDDRPFSFEPGDHYRIIPGDITANDLIMSHVSTNFDRSGFQQDWNIAFPLDRLRELVDDGLIGSLAHYFEDEGVATTQISLIREHTQAIKPPRALWDPFELGRPLGVANDPVFQKRVLLASLKLLEANSGPVLEDFAEDAPLSDMAQTIWACPVNFARQAEDASDIQVLRAAFKQEIIELRPWYDQAFKQRGRTTAGVSGLDMDTIVDFIGAFLDGTPPNPRSDLSLGLALNFAVDDLKAYYYEAVSAQPGETPPASTTLDNWFWQETAASKILFQIKALCLKSDDKMMQLVGKILLVPMSQVKSEGE